MIAITNYGDQFTTPILVPPEKRVDIIVKLKLTVMGWNLKKLLFVLWQDPSENILAPD